ncbi:hypothetical protein OSTOST_02637 [Ostertagia ostertagi]
MENYFDPELCGQHSPSPTESWSPLGSPTYEGTYSDDEQEVKKKECAFCIEERSWTKSTRQLREAKQEMCLAIADEQVSLRKQFEKEFEEKFKKMKYWQDTTQMVIKDSFCLREQISRLGMGIYGAMRPRAEGVREFDKFSAMEFEKFRKEMLRRLAADRCEGCQSAAVELQKELFDYARVSEWKQGLEYFNQQEVEAHRTLMEMMDSVIEDCKRKYELVSKANHDMRVYLWHMRAFFEESTYVPRDVRAGPTGGTSQQPQAAEE